MDRDQIWTTIAQYETAYVGELQRQLTLYDMISDAFPKRFFGPKLIRIVLGSDGAVITHWPNEEYEVVVEYSEDETSEIIKQTPDTSIQLGEYTFSYGGPGISVSDVYATVGTQENAEQLEFRPGWERYSVYSYTYIEELTPELARLHAHEHLQPYITGHLMKLQQPQPNEIITLLKRIITRFQALLDSQPDEGPLQRFLENNLALLDPTALAIRPQVQLGSEYRADFVIERAQHEYILVEIEHARHKLYTKAGQPTSAVTHAEQQVADWRQWVHENIAYARSALPEIHDPQCWVVIGRDDSLVGRARQAIRRRNADSNHVIIMTYDTLLDTARRYVSNLEKLQRG